MVLESLGLISANGLSALAVGLMLWMLKNQKDYERRLSAIENDLYINPKNPSATPLTKQVHLLHEKMSGLKNDLAEQKKSLNKIHETLNRCLPEKSKK